MVYRTLAIRTRYWRPGTDYLGVICRALASHLREGDVVVISEKALSIAQGRIVDEERIRPGLLARILTLFWMRMVWGYLLGPLCRLKGENILRLKRFPIREGASHKQLVLERAGLLQALRHFSEGGIDVSNLPYSYACLPLEDPGKIAREISEAILERIGKRVPVLIVDSDKTYTYRGIHITPRPKAMKGIIPLGVLAFILGRFFKWKTRSTPLACSDPNLSLEEALKIAAVANLARGYGAGRTVWDMAEHFGVDLSGVRWEDMDKIVHRPIVIVRRIYRRLRGGLEGSPGSPLMGEVL